MKTSRALVGLAASFALIVTALALLHRANRVNTDAEGPTCAVNGQVKKVNLHFTLKDVNGHEVSLEQYRGKVLLIDFWATWCAPCQIEIPGFVDLYNEYRSHGLEIIGVDLMDEFKKVAPFMKTHGMHYTVLDGNDRDDLEKAFGPFVGLPTTLLIARDGSICAKHIGIPPHGGAKSLESAVRDAFAVEIKRLL